MNRSQLSLLPHNATVMRPRTSRVTLFVLSAFIMGTCTFAFATVFADNQPQGVAQGPMLDEEEQLMDILDERMHLHLKRLQLAKR